MSARQRRREERNKLEMEGGFEADRMADSETLELNEGRTRELVSEIQFGICEKNRDIKKKGGTVCGLYEVETSHCGHFRRGWLRSETAGGRSLCCPLWLSICQSRSRPVRWSAVCGATETDRETERWTRAQRSPTGRD